MEIIMAEISQVQVLDGSVYDLKDSTARSTLENVSTRTPIALGVKSLTSSGGTVTWTSDNILTDSIVHIYASIYGITATNVSVSAGTLTATFPAASTSYVVNATVDGTATVSGGSSGGGSGDSSAGVSSFNGRSGIVVPLTGDYSYSMISGTPTNATSSVAGLMSAADKAKLDGIATGATKNTATATIDTAGLMSAADKTKLDGIATGATKVAVDTALSTTSTNPVQNKAVATSINTLNTQYTNISGQVTSLSSDVSDLKSADKVLSFNGRTGAVTPQADDYSFSQIDGTVALSQLPDVTSKVTTVSTSAAGLMSATDKAKLDGLVAQSESATAGVTSFNGRSGAVTPQVGDYSFSLLSGSVALTQLPDVTTKVSEATTSASGLMTASEKTKVAKSLYRLDTKTLTAGDTSLTWTDSNISSDAAVDVYASIYGVAPTAMTFSDTTITVTFKAQTTDMDVCLMIATAD